MRVAEGVHIPFRARDLSRRHLEDFRGKRGVQIAGRPDLDLAVAALGLQRREPADLELAADGDQHISALQLQDEARLRLDEMGILIAPRERLDGNVIAANLARNRGEILDGRHDIELALRSRCDGQREQKYEKQFQTSHDEPQNGCAPCAPIENWNWNSSSLAVGPSAYSVRRYCPRTWLNSLGQYVNVAEPPLSSSDASSARFERS